MSDDDIQGLSNDQREVPVVTPPSDDPEPEPSTTDTSSSDDDDGGGDAGADATLVFEEGSFEDDDPGGELKGTVRDPEKQEKVQDFAASQVEQEKQGVGAQQQRRSQPSQGGLSPQPNISTVQGTGRVKPDGSVEIVEPRENISVKPDLSTTATETGQAAVINNQAAPAQASVTVSPRQLARERRRSEQLQSGPDTTSDSAGDFVSEAAPGVVSTAGDILESQAVGTAKLAQASPVLPGAFGLDVGPDTPGAPPTQQDIIRQNLERIGEDTPQTPGEILSDPDTLNAGFTIGGAAVTGGAGALAGRTAAGATQAGIEVVDTVPPATDTVVGTATGNPAQASRGAGELALDLLPINTQRFTSGNQRTLDGDVVQQETRDTDILDELGISEGDLQATNEPGTQATLQEDLVTENPVLNDELTIDTQADQGVAADRADTSPANQPTLDEFTDGDNFGLNQDTPTPESEQPGVVETPRGTAVVDPSTGDKLVVEETPGSSLADIFEDRRGQARLATPETVQETSGRFEQQSPDEAATQDPLDDVLDDTQGIPADTITENTATTIPQTLASTETELADSGLGPGDLQGADQLLDTEQGLDTTTSTDTRLGIDNATQTRTALDSLDQTQQSQQTLDSLQSLTEQTQQTTQTTQSTLNNRDTTNTTSNTVFDIDTSTVDPGEDFTALVKDEGTFKDVGTFDDASQAFAKASRLVENTDDMTFKVLDEGGDAVGADPATNFRKSESGPGFVERRQDAINTQGEFEDITQQSNPGGNQQGQGFDFGGGFDFDSQGGFDLGGDDNPLF